MVTLPLTNPFGKAIETLSDDVVNGFPLVFPSLIIEPAGAPHVNDTAPVIDKRL